MIKEALQEWLRCCIEQGTLEDALAECGFSNYRIDEFKSALPVGWINNPSNTICHA